MLHIYTDGSLRKPNIGAYGYIVVKNDTILMKFVETELDTTHNVMELKAILEAIKIVKPNESATIYSDSQYAIMALTKWSIGWRKNNWKTIDGNPVKNKEIFEAILDAMNDRYISYIWVKGHDGDKYNEQIDSLVQEATLKLKSQSDKGNHLVSFSDIDPVAKHSRYHGFDITKDDEVLKQECDDMKAAAYANKFSSRG